jgi:glycosyltransferase involved in cell wall biosynthesis
VTLPRLLTDRHPQHGVAVHGRELADAVARRVGRDLAAEIDGLDEGAVAPYVHLQFTDRLWADTPEEAAAAFERLAARTRVSVTLHDVPQASDGERNLVRRSECYRRVVAAADGVVCTSRHEALLLEEFVAPGVAPAIIPLPVDAVPAPAVRPAPDDDAAIIGFFYPGKGHAEVLDALAYADARLGLVALGRASAGHEAELDAMIASAAARGLRFAATGYLSRQELLARCRRAAVPIAAHRHVSASGSVATWIASGRRPLVPDTRYFRELEELRPGTLTLYDPDALGDALAAAHRDPDATWLAPGTATGPDGDAVAAAYVRWWESR